MPFTTTQTMNQEFKMNKILVLSIASLLSSFVLAQSAEVSTTEAEVAVTVEESTDAQPAAATEESDSVAVQAEGEAEEAAEAAEVAAVEAAQ